jgi:hypothetical protein
MSPGAGIAPVPVKCTAVNMSIDLKKTLYFISLSGLPKKINAVSSPRYKKVGNPCSKLLL